MKFCQKHLDAHFTKQFQPKQTQKDHLHNNSYTDQNFVEYYFLRKTDQIALQPRACSAVLATLKSRQADHVATFP